MASAAVAVIRTAFPGAHLSLAVGSWSIPAAQGIPDVDNVIDLGNFGTPGRFDVRDVPAAVRAFRRGRYDLAIVLDRSPLVAAAVLLAGITWRVGIDSAGRGFAHGIRVPWIGRCHEVDLYLAVARAASAGAISPHALPKPALAFNPGPVARAAAAVHWRDAGLDAPGVPVVVVHPGGGANPGMTLNAKRWPADRFGVVVRVLAGEGKRVVVVGDQGDAAVVAEVKEAAGTPVVDLSGRLDFATLAAIIERADAYLGNDSVPLHLAVATGTPAVALYGPTDPHTYGPYAPLGGTYAGRGIAIVSPSACSQVRAFRAGPIEACPGCRCIDAIATSDVVQAVTNVIEARQNTLGIPPR
jgi:ADP-heptose:LPS heptosyltransferase